MPTISAYTSDELKRKIDRVIKEEGRNQAQVGCTALELYASLPAAARRAFVELLAAEEELANGVLDRVIAEIARAILSAKWELLSLRMVEEVRESGDLPTEEMSEDEIAELAVRLTSDPTSGGKRRATG